MSTSQPGPTPGNVDEPAAGPGGDTAPSAAAAPDDEPAPPRYPGLPASLYDGLTIWGDYGGAQIRIETGLCSCEHPDALHSDPTSEDGALYLAFRPDAYQSTEDGRPYRLTGDEARALRDLLNIATARGAL